MPAKCRKGKVLRNTKNDKGETCVYLASRKLRGEIMRSKIKQFQTARMGKMLKAIIASRKASKQGARRSSPVKSAVRRSSPVKSPVRRSSRLQSKKP
jgi:hypothetical protein